MTIFDDLDFFMISSPMKPIGRGALVTCLVEVTGASLVYLSIDAEMPFSWDLKAI